MVDPARLLCGAALALCLGGVSGGAAFAQSEPPQPVAEDALSTTDEAATHEASPKPAQADRGNTPSPDSLESTASKIDLSVPLAINARPVGDVSVRVDMEGNGDIDAQRLLDLMEARLDRAQVDALKTRIAGRDIVPMAELSDDSLQISFDPGSLQVDLNVSTSALGVNRIGIAPRTQPDPADFDTPEDFALGLGVTYSHGYSFTNPNEAVEGLANARAAFEGFAQFGGFDGAALFYGFDVTEGVDDVFRRREVQLVKDFYGSAIRASVGDINAPFTAFQGAPPLLGVSVARDYRTIRPFQNIVSSGRGSLSLERDSRVDVLVNGVLTDTFDLTAGRYSLTDFPVTTGSNDVELVIEDDTGRRETTDFSFFSQSGLLGEGLFDFAASAGVERRQSGGGYAYDGDLIASGFAEYGLFSWLTVGANGQYRDERQQVGASVGVGTPFGLFTGDIAHSFGDGEAEGIAVGVDYNHAFDAGFARWTINGSAIRLMRDFSTLSLGAVDNTKFVARGTVRAQLDNGLSLGVSADLRDEFDRADELRMRLTGGKAVGRSQVNISAEYVQADDRDDAVEMTASLTYRMGERYSSRVQYNTRDNTRILDFVRSRRRELNDISGRMQISRSDSLDRLTADADLYHNRFEGEARLTALEGRGVRAGTGPEADLDWRISTFLGYTGGKFGIGRRSDQGFALVSRHPTLSESGVAVFDQSGRQHQAEVGWLGAALIPIERAYTPRQHILDVDPLPIGYDIGAGQIDMLPGLGLGYAYTIGSDASRTVLGTLVDAAGDPVKLAVGMFVPAELADSDAAEDDEMSRQFFSNSAGRLVVEKVAPGDYVIVIDDRRTDIITVEDSEEGLINVGKIVLP